MLYLKTYYLFKICMLLYLYMYKKEFKNLFSGKIPYSINIYEQRGTACLLLKKTPFVSMLGLHSVHMQLWFIKSLLSGNHWLSQTICTYIIWENITLVVNIWSAKPICLHITISYRLLASKYVGHLWEIGASFSHEL